MVGIYILIIELKDRMKDKNPLPLSQSEKKNMTCEENLRVKWTLGEDLDVNIKDGTLLFEIGTNLGL